VPSVVVPSVVPSGVTQVLPQAEPVLEDHGGFQRAMGWMFAGAGLVGLGVGAYFGAQWLDENSVYQTHCRVRCDAVGSTAQDNARHDARSGETAAGVGGAAMLLGAVVVLTAPGPRLIVNRASIDLLPMPPTPGAGRGGVVVRGLW
jgi:hypothetical protein